MQSASSVDRLGTCHGPAQTTLKDCMHKVPIMQNTTCLLNNLKLVWLMICVCRGLLSCLWFCGTFSEGLSWAPGCKWVSTEKLSSNKVWQIQKLHIWGCRDPFLAAAKLHLTKFNWESWAHLERWIHIPSLCNISLPAVHFLANSVTVGWLSNNMSADHEEVHVPVKKAKPKQTKVVVFWSPEFAYCIKQMSSVYLWTSTQ